ncbi:hypothetical protein AEAC466_13595 [Asticcacaulis sp. AC466]|uniref:TOMM precursor leader peptide-binding protein n=1 Tax=Asticcacaulis sp. AC466 TaxID=1282362 RepID=UPI0003C3B59A|nr:TOMM precursor leader peptide-binding protein [Asticcacaulis sp. AC466]ESQ83280.1 hypothetical protein AEAC466_13595 [Asticcacaulis sp. AC466]
MSEGTIHIDPAVDVVVQDNGIVRFLTPHGDLPLSDPFGLVRRVTDQCRQGVTDDALADASHSDAEKTAVTELVRVLTDRRVLTREPAPSQRDVTPHTDVLADWLRHYGGAVETILPAIYIDGAGVLATRLREKLALNGFPVADRADGAGCHVAVSDTADLDCLRSANAAASAAKRPFLPVWLDRACVNWGPMSLPGATGCLECRYHREQAATRSTTPILTTAGRRLSASLSLADLAAVMASAEILRWALGAHIDTDVGMAWRFDILTADLSGSRVSRLPRCPSCGIAAWA